MLISIRNFNYFYLYLYNYTYLYICIYGEVIYIHMQIHIFVAITSVLVESRPLGLSSTTESPERAWNYEVSTVGRHHKKHCVQRRQVFLRWQLTMTVFYSAHISCLVLGVGKTSFLNLCCESKDEFLKCHYGRSCCTVPHSVISGIHHDESDLFF